MMYNISMSDKWKIEFYSEKVQREITKLPKSLYAKFLLFGERMIEFGPYLGMPHTKPFGDGLLELRLKGKEVIGRVFYCAVVDNRIVFLHSFVKKSQKTPLKELNIAKKRKKEVMP